MSEINWEVAADGTAERLVTCEGAVYWAKDGYIWNNHGAEWHKGIPTNVYLTIATRPQQKTVADEQEGEKWTHVVDDDEGQLTKCRKHLKLCNGSDWVYVCEKGEYFVPSKMGYCGVKPIKPTISKAQAWDKLMQNKMNSAEVNTIKQQYDIVEVPAND